MIIGLILLLIVFKLVVYLIHYQFDYWKRRGIPYLKPESIVGNMPGCFMMRQYVGDAYKSIYKTLKESGHKLGGIFHMLKPMLIIVDPQEIRNFLSRDFEHFSVRDNDLDVDLEIMGYNLFFNQDKDNWKYIRNHLSKIFRTQGLKSMFGDALKITDRLHQQIKRLQHEPLDMKELVSDYTAEVAFSCFFGLNTQLLEASREKGEELRNIGKTFISPNLTTMVHGFLSGISGRLALVMKIRILPKYISDYFLNMTDDVLEYREKENIQRPDLFHELMNLMKALPSEASSGNWSAISEQNQLRAMSVNKRNVAAQCLVFYAAGFETSSFTISSCLHAAAYHPEIQKKIQDEVEQVLVKHNNEFTYEALQEMTYLDMVISETLRLFPPVPELMRKCTKSYQTNDGLTIDEGVRVIVPVHAIHSDPALYPEPESFIPERFTSQEIAKRDKYTYLPFGHGPRSCIGLRFGLLQVKLGVASILRKYNVFPDSRSPFPPKYSPYIFVSAHNTDGFWLKLTPREETA